MKLGDCKGSGRSESSNGSVQEGNCTGAAWPPQSLSAHCSAKAGAPSMGDQAPKPEARAVGSSRLDRRMYLYYGRL